MNAIWHPVLQSASVIAGAKAATRGFITHVSGPDT